ncbi:GntR family transcriptional regulator [Salipiger thiooxidans]|uniref:GntR family transcriptional regulator n=1 Tax=Salipiger thiooxidans TaxID=282683 RepID=UPI001CD35594|nr:GntR family transcriptional regulator [Salipiger thiooxidans]MCA0845936.1 GntR family transcriptional regulator [Salipiger thiooxidans]
MAPCATQESRSELICAALRSAILERALPPGMKLPEDSPGERFGASRTLIRQALERLAAEGLVELLRNRGATVASPSLEEATPVPISARWSPMPATCAARAERGPAQASMPRVVRMRSALSFHTSIFATLPFSTTKRST